MASLFDFINAGAQGLNGLLGGVPGQVAMGANNALGGVPGQIGRFGEHELQALGLLTPGMANGVPSGSPSAPPPQAVDPSQGDPMMARMQPPSPSGQPAPNDGSIQPGQLNPDGSIADGALVATANRLPLPTVPDPSQINPSFLSTLPHFLHAPGNGWTGAVLDARTQAFQAQQPHMQAQTVMDYAKSLPIDKQRPFIDAYILDPAKTLAAISSNTQQQFGTNVLKDNEVLFGPDGVPIAQNRAPVSVAADNKLATVNPVTGKTSFASPYGDGSRYGPAVMKNGVPQKYDYATQTWVKAEGLSEKDRFEMAKGAAELGIANRSESVGNVNRLLDVPQYAEHQQSAGLYNDLYNASRNPGGVSDAVLREATARIATGGKATQFASNMFDHASGPLAALSQFGPQIMSGQKLTPVARQAMLQFAHDKAVQDRDAFVRRVQPVLHAYQQNGVAPPDISAALTDIPGVPGVAEIPRGYGVPQGRGPTVTPPAQGQLNPPRASQAQPVNAPLGAVQLLKANPNLRSAFDAKYGAGASQRVLGGSQ